MSNEENTTKRQQRIQELIGDLGSKNERKIVGALKRIPHEGSPAMMEALFNLYAQSPSEEVELLLEKVVHNLKDPACVDPIIDLLSRKDKQEQHPMIIGALWQSGLDVSEHVEFLIERAIDGSFLTAIEVMTVIENQEFDNDDALTKAIQAMDKAVEKKGEKQDLLVSLRQILLDKLLGEQ